MPNADVSPIRLFLNLRARDTFHQICLAGRALGLHFHLPQCTRELLIKLCWWRPVSAHSDKSQRRLSKSRGLRSDANEVGART
jgi:hypothetical protein